MAIAIQPLRSKAPFRDAAILTAALLSALSASALAAPPEILVFSNRADLISGGDALVVHPADVCRPQCEDRLL